MISLASPEALYPLVRESISGALDFMIRRALIETAVEFCRQSQLVQSTIGPVSVEAGDSVLLVPADQPYQGRQLIRVFGEEVQPGKEPPQLRAGIDYLQLSGNELRVNRNFDGFTVVFVVEPRLTATTIPQILIDDYPQALACGAVSRMAAKTGKAWSNSQLAAQMKPYFVEGYRDAYRWRLENTLFNSFQNPVIKQEFF
ncbi:TPA: hypothetical protein R4057_002041 [Kluyvera ascorbata]|uniref:hypothetical protein n=1 Tax=Kluyvera ascorbata TaxID=51288 RepID=UPI0028A2D4E6|nr:hypothetical protein [Kluyvera ascorbata]HED3065088.1 hypothetical protein [Kluyvera ascorbata]